METLVTGMLPEPQGNNYHVWVQQKPLKAAEPDSCSYLTPCSGTQPLAPGFLLPKW